MLRHGGPWSEMEHSHPLLLSRTQSLGLKGPQESPGLPPGHRLTRLLLLLLGPHSWDRWPRVTARWGSLWGPRITSLVDLEPWLAIPYRASQAPGQGPWAWIVGEKRAASVFHDIPPPQPSRPASASLVFVFW